MALGVGLQSARATAGTHTQRHPSTWHTHIETCTSHAQAWMCIHRELHMCSHEPRHASTRCAMTPVCSQACTCTPISTQEHTHGSEDPDQAHSSHMVPSAIPFLPAITWGKRGPHGLCPSALLLLGGSRHGSGTRGPSQDLSPTSAQDNSASHSFSSPVPVCLDDTYTEAEGCPSSSRTGLSLS